LSSAMDDWEDVSDGSPFEAIVKQICEAVFEVLLADSFQYRLVRGISDWAVGELQKLIRNSSAWDSIQNLGQSLCRKKSTKRSSRHLWVRLVRAQRRSVGSLPGSSHISTAIEPRMKESVDSGHDSTNVGNRESQEELQFLREEIETQTTTINMFKHQFLTLREQHSQKTDELQGAIEDLRHENTVLRAQADGRVSRRTSSLIRISSAHSIIPPESTDTGPSEIAEITTLEEVQPPTQSTLNSLPLSDIIVQPKSQRKGRSHESKSQPLRRMSRTHEMNLEKLLIPELQEFAKTLAQFTDPETVTSTVDTEYTLKDVIMCSEIGAVIPDLHHDSILDDSGDEADISTLSLDLVKRPRRSTRR